jgi:hypothetical protein
MTASAAERKKELVPDRGIPREHASTRQQRRVYALSDAYEGDCVTIQAYL